MSAEHSTALHVDAQRPAVVGPDARSDGTATPSFIRRHLYALLVLVVVICMAGHSANQLWASPDFWVHLAAVREFASSLMHPANPLVVGRAPDPYLSPYAFALAVTTRLTGLAPVTALALAGLANVVVLFVAMRAFVRRLSPAELAPVLTLVFTLTAWGIRPWRWSGFFNLNSLGTVLPLSSTFASGIGLLTVAALCDGLRNRSRSKLVLAGLGAALTLLCHPMTAVWVGLVAAAFVVSEAPLRRARRAWFLIAVVVGAVLLASAWPYFSIWKLMSHSGPFDASNAAIYRSFVPRTFLAFPGFVILGARFVRRHRDPLALGALFGAVVYVYGDVSGHYALGRVLPGIMLMAHTAMAVWVAELIARRPATRELRYAVAGVATVVVLGGIGSAAAVPRVVPRSVVGTNARHGAFASLVAPYEHLDHVISRDDVVVASHAVALGVAASSGKVIAPPAPAPFVTDTAARQGVVSTLLSPQTTEREFRAVVEQYDVKWFVVLPSETADLAARLLDGDLHPELATKTLRIFRVVGPAGT